MLLGTAANNVWSAGIINSNTVQSNLYIEGHSTLRVTGGAAELGSNIIIGADYDGESTLEFKNQTATLQVKNNAYIEVSVSTSDLSSPNQILFDTDVVTQGGTVTKGIAADIGSSGGTDSFIDNFGIITRSNPGTYQIDLPIRNELNTYHDGVLDLQSNLWISGWSLNKAAGASVHQVGGQTILRDSVTLRTDRGLRMDAGELLTYGSQALIQRDVTGGATLDVRGGTIKVSADNPALYGVLQVTSFTVRL